MSYVRNLILVAPRAFLLYVIVAMCSPQAWSADEPVKTAIGATSIKCDDTGHIFELCRDQGQVYSEAFHRAKAEKKTLVVIFGAEWCPWCVSLHKILGEPQFGRKLAREYVLADIAVYQGKEKLASGESVLQKIQEQAHYTKKIDGIPILVLVNPRNKKTVILDTAPLEKNTKTRKGHDPKKVLAALKKATRKLR